MLLSYLPHELKLIASKSLNKDFLALPGSLPSFVDLGSGVLVEGVCIAGSFAGVLLERILFVGARPGDPNAAISTFFLSMTAATRSLLVLAAAMAS